MKTTVILAGYCFAALLFTGCYSSQQFVPLPNQTKRLEDPSRARIYVIRRGTVFDNIMPMPVSDNGKLIGRVGNQGYICWERPAGETIVTIMSIGPQRRDLTIEPGRVYYFIRYAHMGAFGSAALELVDAPETEGKKLVKISSRPKVEPPPPAGFTVEASPQ